MSTAEDRRFWDRAARKYARDPIADLAGYERTLEQASAHLGPGDAVLELGCGTASTALRLAEATRRYLATDLSSEMIAISKEKLAEAACSQLELRQATAETMASDGEQFDAVLGFNYLHLAGDLEVTLRHVHTLLSPGGLFLSKTPCLSDMGLHIRLAVPLMRLFGKAPTVAFFSAAELEQAIRSAGFEVLSVERHASKGRDFRPFVVARKR
jgi:cyclopropane fatty-acyl-phospholipid synthase-like methyltransferase